MNKNDLRWLENFDSFKKYINKYNELPEKGIKSNKGVDLHTWYSTQRSLYNKGKLKQERVEKFIKLSSIILEKSNEEINYALFKREVLENKEYNPNINFLLEHNVIDMHLYHKCINSKKYYLEDIVDKHKGVDCSETLFLNCIRTIKAIPNNGYCRLFARIEGTDLVELYLEDKKKFVNDYCTILCQFYKDYESILGKLNLPERKKDIIDMYYGLSTGKWCSVKEISIRYKVSSGYVSDCVRSCLHKFYGVITYYKNNKLWAYSDGNVKTDIDFYKADLMCVTVLPMKYNLVFRRRGINSFEELHTYLIKNKKNDSSMIDGMLRIRGIGLKAAREIVDITKKLGIYEKVLEV